MLPISLVFQGARGTSFAVRLGTKSLHLQEMPGYHGSHENPIPWPPWSSRYQGALEGWETRHRWTCDTWVPCSLRRLGRNGNLISRRLVYQDDRVLMPRRSRGDRTTLGTGRQAAARRDGCLGCWVPGRSIDPGPQALEVPRELEVPGAFEPKAPSTPRDQGANEAGTQGANLFDRASRQCRQPAQFPCDLGAAPGCMTLADGNQGTNAPDGPGAAVHLDPNITGPLATRGVSDMLAARRA